MDKNIEHFQKISVITPNYNGATFIEDTILSVVSQKYPNLEYIIVDGGSTDESMQIIKRYSHNFAHILCEKDKGHADALNKGFKLATGEVLAWINSDDLLLPGALHLVNQVFSTFPDVKWLTGRPFTCKESGILDPVRPLRMWSWIRFLCGDFRYIQQESTFWRKSLWDAAGGQLNMQYHLANDFDLWLRFFQSAVLYTVDAPIGCFRMREGQRSVAQAESYEEECERALKLFINSLPAALVAKYFALIPDEQMRTRKTRPQSLSAYLSETDPPLIMIDSQTGNLSMSKHDICCIPEEFKPDFSIKDDLVFDGFDRIVWLDGPNFSKHQLKALDITLEPFAPDSFVPGGLSEVSPPTVFLAGPAVLTDWGRGKMTLQIFYSKGTISHDLCLNEIGRHFRIKVLISEDRYAILLDGSTIAVGRPNGRQVSQSPYLVLGGGHADRFWVGSIIQFAITVEAGFAANNTLKETTTYHLIHEQGNQHLPRQSRYSIPSIPDGVDNNLRHCLASPLSKFRNRYRGQRCFIMGNGPSLNKMDLNQLNGEIVFACNAVFLLFDRIKWRPAFHTCVDTRAIRDRAPEINQMLDSNPAMTGFYPAVLQLHDGSGRKFNGKEVIFPGPNRYYFNEIGNKESHHTETMFSLDADDYMVQPYTVSITMLQLSVYMGFSEVYLIGCDTNYNVMSTVKQEGRKINDIGLLLTSACDDDCNHFDPRYFGKGREWHNPQVSQMVNHYRWAKLAVRRTGTRIFNATAGGQLEVFPRIDFNSLFTSQNRNFPISTKPCERKMPLLSIAIPAYNRPYPLLHALKGFIDQVKDRYEDEVEIIISDDCSPNDSLRPARELAAQHKFIHYRRYESNIGLEKNLLACTGRCRGDYIWIFGDDDFLETSDALDKILEYLREDRFDVIVTNRTRRSTDLRTKISSNWMEINPKSNRQFEGLRDFCMEFGFISVLGFVSVNIIRRRQFQRVKSEKYFGTMYPQLGTMLEAFHNRPTLLIAEPLVCHRTQSPKEKKQALGRKSSEAEFMADVKRRNAIYFSHPFIAMLDELARCGAFTHDDLIRIPENTVIKGLLMDFLLDCIRLSDALQTPATDEQWSKTKTFLASLPLGSTRRAKMAPVLERHQGTAKKSIKISDMNAKEQLTLSISVISPSFNQAQFLPDCLKSVQNQTCKAMEHLVFDPGSEDDSRNIARGFKHVSLITEPDDGQSDALNKGFAKARGDIIAWLNSDDMFADEKVFERVVERFAEPDAPDIVYGKGFFVDETGKKLRDAYINKDPASLIWRFQQEDGIMQPALFMRRSVIDRVGPLRKDLHFSMDYEYWIRCVRAGIRFVYIDSDLAITRYHLSNKTYGQRGSSYSEVCRMTKEHFGYVNHVWLKRYAEFLTEGHDGVLAHGSNKGIGDKARLDHVYRDLLVKYNGDSATQRLLYARRFDRGYSGTFDEMFKKGLLNKDNMPAIAISEEFLYGPFYRSSAAHIDESQVVAELFSRSLTGRLMIDVGAHYGSAFKPFLDNGWTIHAFEPDDKNRAQLIKKLSKHKNNALVSLDNRCVSNHSNKKLPFYRSQESDGISGLSAFHESHVESQHVDVITLSEYLQDESMPAVDFLKIDTEGHDLFVLQGFPWERTKPAVIECEFEDLKTVPLGYSFHDLAGYLVDKGYKVYVSEWHPILCYGIRHDWKSLSRYPCELSDEKAWGNLLAFRDPIDETELVRAFKNTIKFDEISYGLLKQAGIRNVSDVGKHLSKKITSSFQKAAVIMMTLLKQLSTQLSTAQIFIVSLILGAALSGALGILLSSMVGLIIFLMFFLILITVAVVLIKVQVELTKK